MCVLRGKEHLEKAFEEVKKGLKVVLSEVFWNKVIPRPVLFAGNCNQ